MAGKYGDARLYFLVLIVDQDIAVGEGDADEGADEGDDDEVGGSCCVSLYLVLLTMCNQDMPMAPMDMDDEGDVISEGEE